MDERNRFLEELKAKGGFVRTGGLSRRDYKLLLAAVSAGEVHRLRQGIYVLKDALADIMIDVDSVVPGGVVCLYSAFEHYNLSTVIPSAYCIAVSSKRKVRLPSYPLIDLFYWKKENLDFGIVGTEISGYQVRITDVERTVCDAVKYRNKIGLDVCTEVINSYIASCRLNITALRKYAAKLRVLNVLDRYLEARL